MSELFLRFKIDITETRKIRIAHAVVVEQIFSNNVTC